MNGQQPLKRLIKGIGQPQEDKSFLVRENQAAKAPVKTGASAAFLCV
jgi:hypothetical protein